MNFDKLKALPREKLVELAGKQGVHVHHKAKAETIARLIMEKTLVPQQQPQSMQHVAEKPAAPVYHNTPEDVEAAIAHIKARSPQFESSYSENNWLFKCLGAEEVGNLSIPMRVIVMKAGNVAKGRRVPRRLDGFGDISTKAHSAHTNNVLTF